MKTDAFTKGSESARTPIKARRVAVAALVGTTIEYYDYGIFGYLAVILTPLFFPSDNPAASLLSTLAVFGLAFVVRPIGGIILGRLGDKMGRRATLLFTVLSMGVASGVIGMLPTHQSVGIFAPILLVLSRLVQGFSAGGEVSGAATYVAECAPAGRRGLFGTAVPVGAGLGFVLAAAVAGGMSTLLTPDQMTAWGWRIPFLLAIPLAIACFIVRSRIEDSPEFEELVATHRVVKSPLREVFRTDFIGVLRVAALAIALTAGGYIGLTYMNVYLTGQLGYPPSTVLWMLVGVIVVAVVLQPLAGSLSDRFGRRPLLLAGLAGYVVLPYPALRVMAPDNLASVLAGLLLLFLPYILLQAVTYPAIAELIGARVRFTGVSLGFNVGTVLGGGLSPYLAAALVAATGDRIVPAYLVIGAALIGALALLGFKETAHSGLRE